MIVMPLTEYFWRRQARNGRAVIICVIILGVCFPIGFSSQNGFITRNMSGGITTKTEQRVQESPDSQCLEIEIPQQVATIPNG
jgi:hypothetical protein